MPDSQEAFLATAVSVSLTVADLPASVAWYRDVIGFAVDREHEREGVVVAVSLRAGGVRLLLGQDDGAQGSDRRKGEGVSFQISTDRGVADEIAQRIRESGGSLETEPTDTPWGARVVRFRDPDGFKLAVSSALASRSRSARGR